MFGNVFAFLLVLSLIVLFGWLTYRAVLAKRLWVKIVGRLAAGLLTLTLTHTAVWPRAIRCGEMGTAVLIIDSHHH